MSWEHGNKPQINFEKQKGGAKRNYIYIGLRT